MRIEYGLSTTSLSSLLHATKDIDSPSQENIPTTQGTAAITPTQTQQIAIKESTESSVHTPRETFGLDILEKMSDKEYEVFLRASDGMSDVEKMAAAQALYVFTESYAQDSHQAQKPHPSTPLMKKNPYFNTRDQFLTRYIALYNGAQEVDIVS